MLGESLTPVVPGLRDDEQQTFLRLLAKIDRHGARNRLRRGLYDGRHAVGQLGSVIPGQYSRTASVIGWPAKAVDLLARRMVLTGVDSLGADADDLGLDQVWRDNSLGVESASATVSALLPGVSFLVSSRGGAGEPGGLIHTVDALSGSGDWNARSRQLDSFLSVHERDEITAEPSVFTLYMPGKVVSARKSGLKWTVQRSVLRGPVPVEPVVYRPRAGRRLGSSRISRPVIGLTEAAMRVAIRMEGNADIYSIPQLIVLGADSSVFRNADGSAAKPWQVALGRMFGLPDDDQA